MSQEQYLQELLRFLEASPTAFHATATVQGILAEHGFTRLFEPDDWGELGPGSYYVSRNDSSLIAFVLEHGTSGCRSLRMAGAHTDSPGFRVKPHALHSTGGYVQLGVEVYGGAMLSTWFDRDCSLAGRVVWQDGEGRAQAGLVDFQRPLVVMPSLALHLDPEARGRHAINRQTDLAPILMLGEEPDFATLLLEQLARQRGAARGQVASGEVLAFDLFLYDAQPPDQIGLNGEFVCSARLDNLLSCHALARALAGAATRDSLIVLNDHEEVGSATVAGAGGTFLQDVLARLFPPAQMRRILAASLFVSADNAHALHPNFMASYEPEHSPRMQAGPVIKTNAGQRYATSAATAAQFVLLCRRAGVPCQDFVMRNDMSCGSTIGPLVASGLGVPVVDVGVAQLAMHSVREMAAWRDGASFLQAMQAFFGADEALLRAPLVGGV